MKKIKLHAIGNLDSFNYYIFDKKQHILEILSKLFYEIFKDKIDFENTSKNKKGIWATRKINYEKKIDQHLLVGSPYLDGRIDIYFGDKKIFVTIHCSLELRGKFNEVIGKISKMPRIKK